MVLRRLQDGLLAAVEAAREERIVQELSGFSNMKVAHSR